MFKKRVCFPSYNCCAIEDDISRGLWLKGKGLNVSSLSTAFLRKIGVPMP